MMLKGVQSPHWELFKKLGVIEALRHSDHLLDDLGPALEHARSHIARLPENQAKTPEVDAEPGPETPNAEPAGSTPAAETAGNRPDPN